MGITALQNMLFAGGLAELKLSPNFTVGQSAEPKGKLTNNSETTTPDNIPTDNTHSPVEADDFERELASKIEQPSDESSTGQTDATAQEPATETPEAETVPAQIPAQVTLESAEGFQVLDGNAVAGEFCPVENELAAGPGNAGDAVSAVIEKPAGDGQANMATPEKTAEAINPDNVTITPDGKALDTGLAEVKTAPDKNSMDTNAGEQESSDKLKPQEQVLVEKVIKNGFEQGIEKETGEIRSGSKNIDPSIEKPVQNGSVIKKSSPELTDEKAPNQQFDAPADAEITAGKQNIKTTAQPQFNNSLNAQVNNQVNVNDSGAEQITPLTEAVIAEPKAQASQVEQQSADVLLSETAERAGQQIQNAISASVSKGQDEITVQLNPPELGRVSIKLQQENGQITGLLEFSKAQTRVEVEQLLPQLVRGLQDAGIAVRKVDVVQTQTDNSGYEQFKEHVGQDNNGQQQFGSSQSHTGPAAYEWLGESTNYDTADWAEQHIISDKGVNVLV